MTFSRGIVEDNARYSQSVVGRWPRRIQIRRDAPTSDMAASNNFGVLPQLGCLSHALPLFSSYHGAALPMIVRQTSTSNAHARSRQGGLNDFGHDLWPSHSDQVGHRVRFPTLWDQSDRLRRGRQAKRSLGKPRFARIPSFF